MLDDKMLIDLVKQHPILYDSSHINYMDVNLKINVWTEIGAQLNSDADRCKTRWNNIRDNYKKSLKKLKQHKSSKPYRFACHMNFLKKYLERRGHKINPNLAIVEEKIPEENITEDDDCNSESQPEVAEEEEPAYEESSSITPPDCEVVISVPKPQPLTLRKRKFIRESPSSILMKYLLEKKSAQAKTAPEQQTTVNLKHPVDAFLFGLSPILKSLPQDLLMLAKSEIFACVQKYEMKQNNSKINGSTSMNNMDIEASQVDEEEEKLQKPFILGTTGIKECPESVTTQPLSPLTPDESRQKKQKLSDPVVSQNDLLKSTCELLSRLKDPEEMKDEYQHIAKLWTCKLKALVPMQKRLAERAINEILFEADLGTLHRNSQQINYYRDSMTPHSSNLSVVGSNSVMGSHPPVTQSISLSQSSVPFNNTVLFAKTELDEPSL